MYPTSTQCRTQQARHEATAAETGVADVRRRSTAAARAWAAEAVRADRREAPFDGYLSRIAVANDELARSASENPDRGRADG